ncbi:ABC transporter permease/substrate-binding protein [Corynebacterium sp. ES2794-CONJ1]|uniref:ABC transporter permease/substrate-binding protein n=1 Tax=unclassified Corynebacterium TaxID=2624378 RepID=UPI002169A5DD|nr:MULTISPECIES: ABC transporter permease/substrate-binding protein [unclassified Corynebacterium]MCS4489455.1 ABC transporter permease/substrate-binding protein [Corynebacterium sp. ES2775-CONJ]MCS4491534.1 ABC transporter permease/substrate-binding protein [Corynebacterium sp. ES2715-CONJ3]MCS4531366.1 ABC transporter permease/substrate-binding protein [Corynebacterium sp. ES2730-CONJ]MCU9518753.1 ABC transporter permease/substrate-binding protein [Corynebacterium sp. ES2794-CONJ1]
MRFYGDLIIDHLMISLGAAIVAALIGVATGVWLSTRPKIATPAIAVVNIAYTIPSIALLGVLITVTGIGNTTAVIALVVYGLLPVVRSTFVSMRAVDPALIEAARGMGATKRQVFRTVTFPLALPQILASIRTMVTMTIALAGIASFVGAGGLGVAIYRGITTGNQQMIVIGSALVAALALISDALLAAIQKGLTGSTKTRRTTTKGLVATGAVLMVLVAFFAVNLGGAQTVRIATKPNTENLILGKIMQRMIEENSDYLVSMTDGVGGGTSNIQSGMKAGDFDMYPEYTGTAWQVILKNSRAYDESQFAELNDGLRAQVGQEFNPMFGFNNTYSIAVNAELAKKYSIKTFSDLTRVAPSMSFGAEYDFYEREDGYDALAEFYGLSFKNTVDMDNGLKYQAILDGKIDAITVFTTDGQLTDPRIVVLEDDKNFYPSYEAGVLSRIDFVRENPEIAQILSPLQELIDEATMANLNNQVEVEGKTVAEVAEEFAVNNKLIGA